MCIQDTKTSFNVASGFVWFPAEQYAIQTGQRPKITRVNIGGFDKEGNKIAGYRKQR
jgi:hypothetical protein